MSDLIPRFLTSDADLSTAMRGEYDGLLVLLSITVASLAGYSALLIADRIRSAPQARARILWNAMGAVAMGVGIWSMHFLGMLAFEMPMPMGYDQLITGISVLPGVLASAFALRFLSRPESSFWNIQLSGLLMASGIGTMHYTGMSAMVMAADIVYDPLLFAMSIGVAHLLATFSLAVESLLRRQSSFAGFGDWPQLVKVTSAALMGCAVAGMHYTAMTASYYFPNGEVVEQGFLSPSTLAIFVTCGSLIVMGIAIVSTVVDRRLQLISGALLASEERFRTLFELNSDGIVTIDREGRIEYFNRAACKMFQVEEQEVVGRTLGVLARDEDRADCEDAVRAFVAVPERSSPRGQRELIGRRRDGTDFPFELSLNEFAIGDERGVAGMVRDLSEKRALEAQLLQSQKLESIGQLAAGIAHEINTPAQFVSDNLKFLDDSFADIVKILNPLAPILAQDEPSDDSASAIAEAAKAAREADLEFLLEDIPPALAQSRDGVRRISEIVLAMKEFSHPGSAEKAPVDLNRAIESTTVVARSEWKYAAELELDLAADMPPVPCLAGEVNQTILIMIVNAAHAIESARGDAGGLGAIRISTRVVGDQAEICIGDDGPGVPAEVRDRIFDPFFTTKEVGKGTGQGLSIARSVVVDKHGGTLELLSEPGQGATFRIRLPLGDSAAVVEEASDGAEAEPPASA